VTGRQDPSPTMMKEGQEGCGGRTEERIPASGVVWKEAPESAIHSVLTGGVRPMALKDCASAAWSHPPRPGWLLAGWSGRGPERCEQGSGGGEHGRRLGLRTRPPLTLKRPHRDAPWPWGAEGWPGRTSRARSRSGSRSRVRSAPSTTTTSPPPMTPSASPTPGLAGERSTKEGAVLGEGDDGRDREVGSVVRGALALSSEGSRAGPLLRRRSIGLGGEEGRSSIGGHRG